MRGRIDLNADLGEGVTDDDGLLAVVTSANVACGYHAGDAATMLRVCEGAAARGVAVGAQVSYLDRANFGRVDHEVSFDVLAAQVAHQVGLLADCAAAAGTVVGYVKPHGALYHRVYADGTQAAAVLAGSAGLAVLGFPGSELLRRAEADGRVVRREGFPDRGYTSEGLLIPRGSPGAVIVEPDRVAARAVALARAGRVQSLCVHGDHAGAVATATELRRTLEAAGFVVHSFGPQSVDDTGGSVDAGGPSVEDTP